MYAPRANQRTTTRHWEHLARVLLARTIEGSRHLSDATGSRGQWRRRRHLRAADTHIRAAWRAPPEQSSSWTDAARSSRSGAGATIGPFVTEQTFSGQTRRIAACIRLRSQTHYERGLHGAPPPSLFARLSFFVSGPGGNRIKASYRRVYELGHPVDRSSGLAGLLRGLLSTARLLPQRQTAAEDALASFCGHRRLPGPDRPNADFSEEMND